MITESQKKTWRQYEAGRNYKRQIGLYSRVEENERFYRGDQWRGGAGLPKPVFNIVSRIVDYLVSTAAVGDVKITYLDENLPFAPNTAEADVIRKAVELMSQNAAYRWEHSRLQSLIYRLLYDAALTGDGLLYCSWDPDSDGGGGWRGDIVTEAIDSTNIFPADTSNPDIQSQDYIIISGRASVDSLRREAKEAGMSEQDISKIHPDSSTEFNERGAGELAKIEPEYEDGEARATYLIKFFRENGLVVFEKSTRDCLIRRAVTPCKLYPVAHFSWQAAKNCFFGNSPVSSMIANQKYINRAYAMVMKHMTDTAFSKVIYDRTRIPEWTNEVGEAIAAVGGGNLADAVTVVGTGKLEEGYLALIENAVTLTKELSGATETALGNVNPTNTSAILALREASMQALERVQSELYLCLEQMACIWADMTLAFCPDGRPLRTSNGFGKLFPSRLHSLLLRAKIDICDSARYSASGTQSVLDRLLDGGHITLAEYLDRLPEGLVPDRLMLAEAHRKEKNNGRNDRDDD
ncbi:MAG: hypothetical protein IJD70_03120 [Clostridia bacterium]|nr:hypothetical protein [Clostridia bacterium]